ncbi:hypothetical protein KEM54_004056 [Ascosphaera aggregata]|nr:hypothetical protein KEM54_004056 [Ascosphaera aggregata]
MTLLPKWYQVRASLEVKLHQGISTEIASFPSSLFLCLQPSGLFYTDTSSSRWKIITTGLDPFADMPSCRIQDDLGVVAEAIAAPEFLGRFKRNDNDPGLVVSMFTLGAFCGAYFGSPLGDCAGKRTAIATGAMIFLLGGGIQTGALSIITYGVDVSPCASAVDAGLGFTHRAISGAPRWLSDHDQADKGLLVLAQLHAHGDTTDTWVQVAFQKIQQTIAYEHEHEASCYLKLFQSATSFGHLLACVLQASMQMAGVFAIQYYSVTIMGINAVIAFAGRFLRMMAIDYTGQRWVLIGGNISTCIMFINATVLLAEFPPTANMNESAEWGFIAVT